MSQYSTGTASVTNNSPTVTGTNTLWLANVTAGDSFTVAGDGVVYDVASVDSDTQVTLSAPYAGTTASGVVYAIGTGFTVPDSFPEMSQGDIETATIFTRAMRKIQGKFTGIAINTTAEIGQAVSDHVALPDPHSQYADQANTYTETEVDNLLDDKADQATTYTETEVDNLLDDKADQATTYTETEVDNLLDDKADQATTYTETEIDNLLDDKADQANTYTETEVDGLTGSLAYPNTTLASSSDISESVEPAIAAYPHIQGFRTGTGTALTFAQAVEEAAERGARLLTIQELEAGVCQGAGHSYDIELTWTSSPAGVGLVYGNLGGGDGTRVVLNTSTDTAAGGYAVSVIGQRQWTDTQYAGLDGGANANFTTMPQVGGDPIVESGSNADGEWTRWSDGTLIAQNRLTLAYESSTEFRLIWTYPSSFISAAAAPSISSVDFASDASFTYFEPYHLSNKTGPSDIDIRLVMAASVAISSDTFKVGASVIGRWK